MFPKPRGTVKVSNRPSPQRHPVRTGARLQVAGASRTVREPGTPFRMRMSRWAASGVLDRVFQRLQQEQLIDLEVLGPGQHVGQGSSRRLWCSPRSGVPRPSVAPRGGLNTKIHMVAASACSAVLFALSPGQDHDAPHGRELLKKMGPRKKEAGRGAARAVPGSGPRL